MLSIRRVVLGFLCAWHGVAAVKNLCDLLAAFALVPGAERYASGNFAAMEKLLAPLHPPREVLGTLLTGVIGVETSVAVAFARGDEERAFPLALALFGTFALIDEAFADYALDETHRDIVALLLIASLALRDVPPDTD